MLCISPHPKSFSLREKGFETSSPSPLGRRDWGMRASPSGRRGWGMRALLFSQSGFDILSHYSTCVYTVALPRGTVVYHARCNHLPVVYTP